MNWEVVAVKPLEDYQLQLTFITGEVKIFDMKPYLGETVFKPLCNKAFFKLVNVAFSSIEWPNDIDIAPETLYEESVSLK